MKSNESLATVVGISSAGYFHTVDVDEPVKVLRAGDDGKGKNVHPHEFDAIGVFPKIGMRVVVRAHKRKLCGSVDLVRLADERPQPALTVPPSLVDSLLTVLQGFKIVATHAEYGRTVEYTLERK